MSGGRKPASWYRQSGVVAVRTRDGKPQVLLVTSFGGKRWVLPKGIVEKGYSPSRSAAKEAWEEAGVGIWTRIVVGCRSARHGVRGSGAAEAAWAGGADGGGGW